MCGGKYDWGEFDEDRQEWKFPRFLIDGKMVEPSMARDVVKCGAEIKYFTVLMRSARLWAMSMRAEAAMGEIHRAFSSGFLEEMTRNVFTITPPADTVLTGHYDEQKRTLDITETNG